MPVVSWSKLRRTSKSRERRRKHLSSLSCAKRDEAKRDETRKACGGAVRHRDVTGSVQVQKTTNGSHGSESCRRDSTATSMEGEVHEDLWVPCDWATSTPLSDAATREKSSAGALETLGGKEQCWQSRWEASAPTPLLQALPVLLQLQIQTTRCWGIVRLRKTTKHQLKMQPVGQRWQMLLGTGRPGPSQANWERTARLSPSAQTRSRRSGCSSPMQA